MRNIVYKVTWKHMKMNKKRTWTTFFGIFFMVLLMTCIFAGRKTAIGYLQQVGEQSKGKWHVSLYGISEKMQDEIQNLGYVKKAARSVNKGCTDFPESGNPMRPYLLVKSYETDCFDWMNLKLKEGRLPENGKEIVISQSALDEGSTIAVGDTIKAEYFDRTITGIAKGITTTFPFFEMSLEYGETMAVPQDFPFYEENDSFRINKIYSGDTQEMTVVGIVENPWFEEGSSAGYSAFTFYDGQQTDCFNLSVILDLKTAPNSMYQEIREIAGDSQVEFNDYVLSFSGDSSDSVVNEMVRIMTVFFLVIIMAAAIVLIYNVFNISFEERSRYLGMLCSVGATGRQKRSSVYFEAFALFLPALPAGILAGCAVVWIGMLLFQPFIYSIMSFSDVLLQKVPVHLLVSWKEILIIVLCSGLTVFLSSVLPAGKISRVGPIECIRGNLEKNSEKVRYSLKYNAKLSAEKLLARNSLHWQKRKTRGMNRAAIIFMVILIVTVSSTQTITRLITYRMVENADMYGKDDEWDYQFSTYNGLPEGYSELRKEIMEDPGVEKVQEMYDGMFIGNIPHDVLSTEYWTDLHKVFNLYYHRELSEEEFTDNFKDGSSLLNLIAVDDETFEAIANASDTDRSLSGQEEKPAVIIVQSGEVSTENWRVAGMEAERYAFYQVEKMTDLKKGEDLPLSLYSEDKQANVDFPLCIAGFATNEQLKDYFAFHSETMWGIVNLETGDKINDVLMDHENPENSNNLMVPTLFLKMNGEKTDLLQRLSALAETDEMHYAFSATGYSQTFSEALNSIIRIMLMGFVLLTSVICLLNLYNSIHGWISQQRHYFAMMVSVGMTQRQIERMLFYEAAHMVVQSSFWSVIISAPLVIGIKNCLIRRFGYVRMAFPWWIYAAAILFTAIVIFAFMLYHYRKEKNYEFRAVLME